MSPLPIEQLFLMLALLWLAAAVFGAIAGRLGIPPVIGELACGLLLGPSLLGWVEPAPTLKALAEIGVVLLLFEVGMETDLRRLARSGGQSLAVALIGFLLPFALGYVVANVLFGLPTAVSLFVGGTLTATSIGITVRVLGDLGRKDSDEAQIIVGAAVLDDVLGVIALALLAQFAQAGEVSVDGAARIALFVLVFLLVAPVAAKLAAGLIGRIAVRTDAPALQLALVVSTILAFGALAHLMGAPVILGGFAAGLAFSPCFRLSPPKDVRMPFAGLLRRAFHTDPEFSHGVERMVRPLTQLFAPVFFVLVGVSMDLTQVDWSDPGFAWLLGALLAVAIAGKWVAGFVLRKPPLIRHAVGLAMVPRGEVGLIFIQVGASIGLLDARIGAALLVVVAVTTLLPPIALKLLYRFAN